MLSSGSAFLEIGITLKSSEGSGKIPVTKYWLIGLGIGILIVFEYFLKIFTGILYGPIDILRLNVLIMSPILSGDAGVKNKNFSKGFVR